MARIVINYFSSVTVLYFVVELTIHNFNISIESINSSLITYIRQKLSITWYIQSSWPKSFSMNDFSLMMYLHTPLQPSQK